MENHPIPQDVTGFKFKLIGSMTVKQFLYLLGFGILTTVTLMFNLNIFLKAPLMLFFASIGVALAFVPIEGRPLDVMITNFVRAIPSENRYIFKKRGVNLASYEAFKIVKQQTPAQVAAKQVQAQKNPLDDKRAILLSRLRNSTFRPDNTEIKALDNIRAIFDGDKKIEVVKPGPQIAVVPHVIEQKPLVATPLPQPAKPVMQPVMQEVATPRPAPKIIDDDQNYVVKKDGQGEQIESLQKQLEDAKQVASHTGSQDAAKRIEALEEALQKALSERDTLNQKVVQYEADKSKKKETVFKPSEQEEKPQTQNARIVGPSARLSAGFPTIPDVPNIILGALVDARGKSLPNILVEVVDSNGIPVRAFKTNALGQFASATPLSNGTYKLYFEDPQKQHEFEILEVSLDGKIFQPIEVSSVDAREKLRRELFGGTSAQVA